MMGQPIPSRGRERASMPDLTFGHRSNCRAPICLRTDKRLLSQGTMYKTSLLLIFAFATLFDPSSSQALVEEWLKESRLSKEIDANLLHQLPCSSCLSRENNKLQSTYGCLGIAPLLCEASMWAIVDKVTDNIINGPYAVQICRFIGTCPAASPLTVQMGFGKLEKF
ncbi:hypothetical protein SprV_0100117500 [Sparganum proliferum]